MSCQNNNYKIKYYKYKTKYHELKKMIGGTFRHPSELIDSEVLKLQPVEINKFTDEVFNRYVEEFKTYLDRKNPNIKEFISESIFMHKYRPDGSLRGIYPAQKNALKLFYTIDYKIPVDFVVYRLVNKESIKSDTLNYYLPFSTVNNMNLLTTDGKPIYGGKNISDIVILKIKIKKNNIYLFIGGDENEITIQPCILRIQDQFKHTEGVNNYIIYECSFEPYLETTALQLIDKNFREE